MSEIQIDMLPLGLAVTNCYIVGNPETKAAIIIDPAADAPTILAKVAERGYQVELILATHTHFDHVLAVGAVRQALDVPFAMHAEGLEQLRTLPARAAFFGLGGLATPPDPDRFIEDGEVIKAAGFQLEARFTPGHSPGHLIFVLHEQRLAFVGDCVFQDSIGRTDLPGSDAKVLKQSIETQILPLPDDYQLLSGHGPVTTLGRERAQNYVLAHLLKL